VVSVTEGKATLVVKVSDDLADSLNAVELVKAGVAELGGKGGGGRPDFAQGGGPDGARADAALAAIERGLAGHAAAAE
jgi:alanyl-tRNA synthetase